MADQGELGRTASILDLWPARIAGPALLTTFTFSPDFFERILLVELIRRGAWPVWVFVDEREGGRDLLEDAPALAGVGRTWEPVFVRVDGGRFHAKVHLFPAEGRALVGSGNLTEGGFGQNLEAFDVLDATTDGTAVAQVRTFFRALLGSQHVRLPARRRRPEPLDLHAPRDPPASGDARFEHGLGGALEDRVHAARQIASGWRELLVAAPFHHPSHQMSQALAAWLGAGTVQVASSRRYARPKRQGWSTVRLQGPDDDRALHAKLVHARGEAQALLVLGSANLTTTAWRGPTIDAVVVREELDATAFDNFLAEVEVVPDRWRELPNDGATRTDIPSIPTTCATHAEVRGGLILVESDEEEGLEATLIVGDDEQPVALRRRDDGTWLGRLPQLLTSAAVLEVVRSPSAPVRLIVSQPQPKPGTAAADVRRALQVVLAGDVRDQAIEELERRVFDVVAELLAGNEGPEATPGGPAAGALEGDEGDDHAVSSAGFDAVVFDVEDLLLRRRVGAAAERRGLLGLVDLLARLYEPASGRGGRRRGDAAAELLDDAEELGGEASSDRLAAELEDALQVVEDARAARVERALEGIEEVLDRLDAVGERSDVALVCLQGLATALVRARTPHDVRAVDVALEVLDATWGVPEWPHGEGGVLFGRHVRGDAVHEAARLIDAILDVLVVEPRCPGAVDGLAGTLDAQPTRADGLLRAVGGILDAAGRVTEGADAPEAWLAPFELARLRDLVASRPCRDQVARRYLEPAWALDANYRRWESTKREVSRLEREIAGHESELRRWSARSERSKAARMAVDTLSPRLVEARRRHDDVTADFNAVRSAARGVRWCDGARSVYDFWERAERGHEVMGFRPRLAGIVSDDVCGCCNRAVPVLVRNALSDPREVRQCPNCRVLLAAGPPRIGEAT